jgi:restriction system protein
LVAVAVVAALAALAARIRLRASFSARFGSGVLRRGVRLSRQRGAERGVNAFGLAFPVWQHAARDGSADRRYRGNSLLWGRCVLLVDGFAVSCRNPLVMIDMVSDLRARGVDVGLCDIELARYRELVDGAARAARLTSVAEIYRQFVSDPARFERFVAQVWEGLGYETSVTPATNDGGYDVVARAAGRMQIVECKCFEPSRSVGRPLIQKLVGANEVVGADEMAFVTTAGFSRAALSFARESGVTCVDGTRLLELWGRVRGGAPADARPQPVDVSRAWLTREDAMAYFPPDVR